MLPIIVALLFLLIGIFCYLLITRNPNQTHRRSAPGPQGLPVIGHLHKLGKLPHRALQAMSRKHGPIMSIRLGQVPTIVISSPEAAEQILKTHDSVFASRPSIEASKYLNYEARGIDFTPFGAYWRYVRKLCTNQLMTASRIESFAPLRRDEVRSMVARLKNKAQEKAVVNLSESVNLVVEEITFRIIGGSEIYGVDIKSLVKEGFRLVGAFNLADYVPFLAPFDHQVRVLLEVMKVSYFMALIIYLYDLLGLTKKFKKISMEVDVMFKKAIHIVRQKSLEKKSQGGDTENPMAFIEVLVSMLHKPLIPHGDQDEDHQKMELINVKAILVDMVAAAFDTSTTVIEWVLSDILKHPEVMERVQQELNDVVGTDRMVEESDLPELAYLEMVIMESFRLHLVSPFLIPRESMADVEINDYFIPKKTRVLINIWAIGRDCSVWSENVESFIPERFSNSDLQFRGNDFRFTPFGSGRRGCPGMQLGLTTVRLVVAQLMHCFCWELANEMLAHDLDMSEKFGLTLTRANHLLVVPTFRLNR